jgi:Fe-S cluster biogenesis protein NfuA
MSEIKIFSEWTPNPNTLKFMVGQELADRTYDFLSKEEALEKSDLAIKLFDIKDIVGVYLGKNFITVTKGTTKEWTEYEAQVKDAITDFMKSGEPVVKGGVAAKTLEVDPEKLCDTGKKILSIIEEEVRPAVAMDGGDIEFKGFENGIVYLRMVGACAGCPSAGITLKMGIEARLKEVVPEVKEVLEC